MTEDARLVYLVHNDSDVLLSLYDLLSGAGFRVAASSNAFDALAYIARAKPPCVLCRWEMREMDGAEFVERAKRASPSTRIVVSSRKAEGGMYEEIRRLGGTDLLPEPFSSPAVLQAVMRMAGLGVPYESLETPAPTDGNTNAEGWNGTCRG